MAAAACCPRALYSLLSLSFFPLSNASAHVPIALFPFNHFLKPKFDCISIKPKPQDAVIDIKLPRRSLLVKFTCNACEGQSQKLVNGLAYERAVFVQCSGCFRHHKLVDNLGLVVEYHFQEETNVDPDINQL